MKTTVSVVRDSGPHWRTVPGAKRREWFEMLGEQPKDDEWLKRNQITNNNYCCY